MQRPRSLWIFTIALAVGIGLGLGGFQAARSHSSVALKAAPTKHYTVSAFKDPTGDDLAQPASRLGMALEAPPDDSLPAHGLKAAPT